MPTKRTHRTRANAHISHALGCLSKAALIDVIADRVYAEYGEGVDDVAFAEVVQIWIDPLLKCRGDRRVDLAARIEDHKKWTSD
jgi:hypothetical protein